MRKGHFLGWVLGAIAAIAPNTHVPVFARTQVAQGDGQTEADRALQEAERLFEEGTAESLRSAIAKLKEAARSYEEAGNSERQAFSLLRAGSIQDRLGEKTTALEYYDRALELYREVGDSSGEAITLNNIGSVYSSLGEKQRALEFYEQALPLLRAVGDRRGEATTLNNIGSVYSSLGEKQRALEFYEQALPLRRTVGDRRGEATTLNNIGSVYSSLGEKQRALEFYEQALPLRRAVGDRRGEATTLNNIGRAYDDLGEKQRALELYEQALPLRRTVGDRAGEAQTLNNIGSVYSSLGEKQRALELYEEALPLLRAVGDRRGEATTLNNIGKVYSDLGEKQRALEFYEEALPLRRAVGDRSGEAATLTNIGVVYSDLGEKQRALEFYEEALPLKRAVGDRSGEAATLTNIGSVYSSLGEKQRALQFYEQALPLLRAVGDRRGEATTLTNIGVVYDDLGEKQQALKFYEQALPLRRAVGDRGGEATTLNNIGTVYNSLGEKQQALDFYEQALSLLRAVGDRRGEGTTLNNIGAVYDSLGEKQRALELYEQALPLRRAVGDRGGEATTLHNIGRVYNSLGEKQRALQFFERALPLFRAVGDRRGEATTLSGVALLQRGQDELQTALATIERSLTLLESLREDVVDSELQTSFFATVQGYYSFYIDLLFQLHEQNPTKGYDARALHATERSRSRTLLDLLAEASADLRKDLPPELLQREANLKQQLDALETQRIQLLAQGNDDDPQLQQQLQRIATDIDALLEDRQKLATEIRQASPGYADIEYPQPLQLRDIQQQVLDDDTVLLQYALGETRSFLFVVTPTDFESYELPPREAIETATVTFARTLSTKGAGTFLPGVRNDSYAIAQQILAPIRERLQTDLAGKRLLVIPDGALHYIPFPALSLNPDTYEPLIRDFEIVNAPSATVLATLRKTEGDRRQGENAIAILADPVFSSKDDRLNPDGGDGGDRATGNVYVEANTTRLGIGFPPARLPGTRQEATTILSLIPGEDREFAAFGFDASIETAASPKIANHRIVHFATHGFANSENPALSGLILSLLDENERPANGFLRLNDIFNLDLAANLVVLSACQTGLGENIRGEGLVGLTRGFMYAGSPRVVVSLWSVDDFGTAALMERFYEKHVRGGLTPARALRQAQLEMLDDEKYRFPYYWAAFTFQGEWR